jgi:hypothetical protein
VAWSSNPGQCPVCGNAARLEVLRVLPCVWQCRSVWRCAPESPHCPRCFCRKGKPLFGFGPYGYLNLAFYSAPLCIYASGLNSPDTSPKLGCAWVRLGPVLGRGLPKPRLLLHTFFCWCVSLSGSVPKGYCPRGSARQEGPTHHRWYSASDIASVMSGSRYTRTKGR